MTTVVSSSINSLTSESVSIDVVRTVVIVRDVTQSKSENILLVDDSGVESEYQYYNEGSYQAVRWLQELALLHISGKRTILI